VHIDGPTLLLEPQAAQVIAVVLHELATNAAKYGSLSNCKGRVEVKWSCGAGEQLSLRWTESGGPPVKTPTHQGFGTRVVGRVVKEQSKGEMRLDWKSTGLECEISLPLNAQKVPEPGSATGG
jgi:two-component sensor histidine kinase